jgi:hypothetical protein
MGEIRVRGVNSKYAKKHGALPTSKRVCHLTKLDKIGEIMIEIENTKRLRPLLAF